MTPQKTRRSRSLGQRAGLVALCLLTVLILPVSLADSDYLAPGVRVRPIEPGEVHAYRLALDAGQVVEIEVEQKGIDLRLTLRAPSGKELVQVDGTFGRLGRELLTWVTEEPGRHELVVAAFSDPAPSAEYELSYGDPRPATAEDRARVALQAETLRALGEKDAAALDGAAARWRELGDVWRWGEATYRRGNLARDPAARLEIWRRIVDAEDAEPIQRGFTLAEIGRLERAGLGDRPIDFEATRSRLLEAVNLLSGHRGAAKQLSRAEGHLGNLLADFVEYPQALRHYEESVRWARAARFDEGEAAALYNLGLIQLYFRAFDEAAGDFETALAKTADRRLAALISLQWSYAELGRGEVSRALRLLADAQRGLDADDGRPRGLIRLALGWVRHRQGLAASGWERSRRFAAAEMLYRAALDEPAARRVDRATALYRLGWLLVDQQRAAEGRSVLEAALRIFEELRHPDGRIETLYQLARSREDDPRAARDLLREAIDIVETLRGGADELEAKAVFFASKQPVFDLYIEVLMRLEEAEPAAGYAAAAFEAGERTRARGLLELLRDAGVELRSRDKEAEIRALEAELSAVERRAAESPAPGPEAGRAHSDAVRILARIAEEDPLYAMLRHGRALSIDAIRADLLPASERSGRGDPDDQDTAETVLLEYHLGESRSFLWVVSADALDTYILPPRHEIEQRALEVYNSLEGSLFQHRERFLTSLVWLRDEILAPAADRIHGKRLLIVADGALQFVPFAALPKPGTEIPRSSWPAPLIEDHEISMVPSASTLVALRGRARRPAATASTLIVADAIYNRADTRIAAASPGAGLACAQRRVEEMARLPGTAIEAAQIHALDRAARSFEGDAARDVPDLRALLGRYQRIHLALHGSFDASAPGSSAIVFSLYDEQGCALRAEESYLRLGDIYDLDLAAELTVLSSCKTAYARDLDGEGLHGLVQGLFYAGTPRVVASLWNVPDHTTPELMASFYENVLVLGQRPAQALRNAQLAFMRRGGEASRAPYHWARFVFQGDFSVPELKKPASPNS